MTELKLDGQERELGSSEAHSCEISLTDGEFVEIVVEQAGIDLILSLEGEGAATPIRVDSPTGKWGPEELVFIATTSATHRVKIEGTGAAGQSGMYTPTLVARRPANNADRELVEADRALRDGRGLLRKGHTTLAVEALERARVVFAAQGRRLREAEVLLSLAAAQSQLGAADAALKPAKDAVQAFRDLSRGRRLAHALDQLAVLQLRLGKAAEASSALEEARHLAESEQEDGVLPAILAHLGAVHHALAEPGKSLAAFSQAIDLLEATGKQALLASTLCDQGGALLSVGRAVEARVSFARALGIYHQLAGGYRSAHVAFQGLAEAAAALGEWEAAANALAGALSEAAARDDHRTRALLHQSLGELERRRGNLGAAREAFEQALTSARQALDRRSEAFALLSLGTLKAQQGEVQVGLALLGEARGLLLELRDGRGEAAACVGIAQAQFDQGQPAAAWEALGPALELFEGLGTDPAKAAYPRRADYCALAIQVLRALETVRPGEGYGLRADQLAGSGSGGEALSENERGYSSIEDPEGDSQPINLARSGLPEEGPRKPRDPQRESALLAAYAKERDRKRRAVFASRRLRSGTRATHGSLGEDATTIAEAKAETEGQLRKLGQALIDQWKSQEEVSDELALCRKYETAIEEDLQAQAERRDLPYGVNPHDLKATGWGVIFHEDADPQVRAALEDFLQYRKTAAGDLYKEFLYRADQTARSFLWYGCGETPGTINPKLVPYYLLIVGGPEEVPFEVQYQLSINHAVGRLAFDSPEDYAAYGQAVKRAETEGTPLPRRLGLISVENGDCATQALAKHLVAPLRDHLPRFAGWEVEVWRENEADKRSFANLLGAEETPGVILASCHGRRIEPGEPGQEDHQGALTCQRKFSDGRPIPPAEDWYFSGLDVSSAVAPFGLIAFLFACYGAGTPVEDNFPDEAPPGDPSDSPAARVLALRPFIARLPKELLRRGALAVVGHVDRGWTLSFKWVLSGRPITTVASLEDCVKQLMDGHRLGHSMRPLHRRYLKLGAEVADDQDRARRGEDVDEQEAAMLWTAHNDARGFIIVGDPAVYALGRPEVPSEEHQSWSRQLGHLDGKLPVYLEERHLAFARQQAQDGNLTLEQWLMQLLVSEAQKLGQWQEDV